MAIYSCKGCQERHTACWDHCEKYQKEKAENERRRALERADRSVRNYVCDEIRKSQNARAIKRKSIGKTKWFHN